MAASADNPGVIARPPLLYGGALAIALVCRWFWPMPIADRTVALRIGLAMAAVAIGIAIWGRRAMKAAGTNIDPGLPALAIVTAGPYRFSRNPLYFALTLLYLGLVVAFNTWWGIIALVPLLIIMQRGVVLREERYLEGKFGETYRAYKARTRRWV